MTCSLLPILLFRHSRQNESPRRGEQNYNNSTLTYESSLIQVCRLFNVIGAQCSQHTEEPMCIGAHCLHSLEEERQSTYYL